jgi:hypothetical protein
MPWKYAVAAVTGSPMTSSTSVIVNTQDGSPMFWARLFSFPAFVIHGLQTCTGRMPGRGCP